MQSKVTKTTKKTALKRKSLCIHLETEKKLDRILELANKKQFGRKVKPDQLLSLALDLVQEQHIVMLQEQTLTNENRMERLRQKHIKLRGPISKDDFLGFTMTAEFQEFLKCALADGETLPSLAAVSA
jgi:hypothetical protein